MLRLLPLLKSTSRLLHPRQDPVAATERRTSSTSLPTRFLPPSTPPTLFLVIIKFGFEPACVTPVVDARAEKPEMNASLAGSPSGTPSSLFLQDLWDAVRTRGDLQSYHLPAAYALLTHVLLSAPFLALDALAAVSPTVRRWRLAAGSGTPPSAAQWLRCLGRLMLRYAAAVLPATALLQSLGSPRGHELPELAPSCWRLCVEVAACLLFFDALFFAWHLAMHR